MVAGIMQLATQGCRNIWLTTDPQITFWRGVYRRYANFAYDTIEEPFSTASFGSKTSVTLTRAGDLLGRLYVRVYLSGGSAPSGASWAWVRRLGHELINKAEISIGGQVIDRHFNIWSNIWYDLTHEIGKEEGYKKLIGDVANVTDMKQTHGDIMMYIPLKFFFCQYPNTPIPIIGLQHVPIKIDITFTPLEHLLVTSGFTTSTPGASMNLRITEATLVYEVMHVENEERRTFVQSPMDILVNTLQHFGTESIFAPNQIFNLQFHHAVKELVWVNRLGKYTNTSGNYKFLAYHATDMDLMRMNASKRFALSLAKYDAGGALILANNMLVPRDDLPQSLLDTFISISAAAVSSVPSLSNVSILGELLSMQDVSLPVSQLFNGVARTSYGDGQPLYDVVIRMPDNFGRYLDGTGNTVTSAMLSFNGMERVRKDALYFNQIQPMQHHTNQPQDGVYVYSFSIKPEEWQPSGAVNWSSLDTSALSLSFAFDEFEDDYGMNSHTAIFATSYNILKIMGGQGGLAFNM